ncbi:MAG: prepilin-type N-terminal cleavage/methylation domain-containing protein [Planctomycetes bacterium]|nr:prepilin-type N-terminal cleavage/methylation domain-containing protein [Planctomycetota bacterium]
MHSKSRSGFTLIELLIVVAIIGVLVTVLVAVLLGAFNKGKDAEARNFMDNLVPQAMQKWQEANGKPNRYPASGGDPSDPVAGNHLLYLELVGKPRDAGNAPHIETNGLEIRDEKGKTVFMDPWGMPYIYRDWSAPPPKGSKAGDKTFQPGSYVKPYNVGTFDIISAGPDKELGTTDDIIRGGFKISEEDMAGPKKKPATGK